MNYLLAFLLSVSLFQAARAGRCYKCAASYADPHIQTFDSAHYQCQGQGDFVMAKSTVSDFELQARFFVPKTGLSHGRNGSSTTAAVLNTGVGNEAKIELQVSPEGFPASSVHDCDIHYYVNDVRKEFNSYDVWDRQNRFYFARRTVENHGWPYSFRQFQFYDSGTILWASKAFDPIFGCYMNLQLCMPCDTAEKDDIVGLFGSPNSNIADDFITKTGEIVQHPPKLGQETEYCQENWCVGKKANSRFLNPDIYHRCTADIETDWDKVVEHADDEIKKQCQGEVNCIIDTIVTGDIETGLRTLEEAKEMGFVAEKPDPTASDMVEEDDSYTCTKAGVESETAFARPDNGSNCFLDDDFNRWGWSLQIDGTKSGSYEYEVWAGAGQCDTQKGSLVGLVTVTYDARTKDCTGKYVSTGGYTLQEFQFYCGTDKYPTIANVDTVAPGQYPCKHVETETTSSDTCLVENVIPKNGVIHAIAHAVSCDVVPTNAPTVAPTEAPTETPTKAPTDAPTDAPTTAPTEGPTKSPSDAPTKAPTETPTKAPTDAPTDAPTMAPTEGPTKSPTKAPTEGPTQSPTVSPTKAPTDAPEPEERNFNAPPKNKEDPPKKGSGSGDPHFKTWTGDKYDYHGECDLVLVDHPTFANGLGLRVHIRTTRVKYFSFIEKVALQIGDDILEFDNDVENFLINGEAVEANRKHHKTMLGDFIIRRDQKAISVRLDEESKAKIDFHTRKNGFPAVIVDGGHSDIFKGSLGLLGEWSTGKKLARDGVTEIVVDPDDATPFALEWQVRDTEPMLFKESRFPQFPAVCTPPAKWSGFRLGHLSMRKEAEEACAHWEDDKEDCIFDVMATRDILVAEEGHIVHVE